MGLWFLSKAGIAEHEGEKLLKENPSMLAWIQAHKAAIGDGWIIFAAVVATCGDPRCAKLALGSLVIGSILKAAGVLPSDAEAKTRALGGVIAGAAPAIQAAVPAVEQIAQAVHDLIQPKLAAQLLDHQQRTIEAVAAVVNAGPLTP